MAYLSQLNVNGNDYDLKDAETRETDTPNTTPFLYRQTPHNADGVFLDELVGCSFGVNQLVRNGDFVDTSGWQARNSSTISVNSGVCTVTPGSANSLNIVSFPSPVKYRAGHKILVNANVKSSASIRITMQNNSLRFSKYSSASGNWESVCGIYNSVENEETLCFTNTTNTNAYDIKNVYICDLTQMFGTAIADYVYTLEQSTAGSGIAWLKSYGFFTKDYYPYNTGELISVKTSGKKYVGFNQWDEEYQQGYWTSSGYFQTANNQLCTKNKIKVTPGATYYFKIHHYHSLELVVCCYDENNDFIERRESAPYEGDGIEWSIPNDTYYIHVNFTEGYGETYNHDICINISKTEGTPKNGDYVPYEEHTYDISNIDLRGIPKLVNNELVYDGDTYDSDGDVTRKYGIVDLGDLSWVYDSSSWIGAHFYAVFNGIKYAGDYSTTVYPIVCSKYKAAARNLESFLDKCIVIDGGAAPTQIQIKDTNYTDATTFKTAMNGVYLVYELVTPTTETTDPYTNPQICDKDGTEEFIDNRTVPIPVGHNSRYADLPAIMDGDYLNYMARNFASDEYVDRALEEVDAELDTKVDKVSGKDLSTNDYTDAEKALVATVPNKADSVDVEGTKSVSGNPLTLTDCAPINAESLVVEFSPKQDLHGQSAPYVGGAGKNKLPLTVDGLKAINTAGTWSGNVYTREGCTFEVLTDSDNNVVGIKVNATSSHNTATFSFGDFTRISGTTYILNGCPANGTTSSYKLRWNDVGYDYGNGITTDGTAGTGTVTIDIMSNTAVTNLIFLPMIRLATETDDTFAPYSNICPITGYTECEVDDVGTNLANNVLLRDVSAYTPNGDGYLKTLLDIPTGDYSAKFYGAITTGYAKIVNRTQYTDYFLVLNGVIQDAVNFHVNDGDLVEFHVAGNDQTGIDNYFGNADLMLNKGNVILPYEPYRSSNVTIQFGQTVYGGKSNFTDGGTSDEWENVDLGDLSWTYYSQYERFDAHLSNVNKSMYTTDDMLCSCFKPDYSPIAASGIDGTIAIYNDGTLLVICKEYTDGSTFKTAMTGQTVCYKKATPTTISTPPTDLKLLKGTNNLTTNGTTINLGYQPDNVVGELKGEIQEIKEMSYLRILDNDIDTEVKNYRLYYRLISSSYTLVNLAEMLQHRFLFVEVIQNPSGTANHKLLHSALIDPRTIDGFEYQMKAGTGDTVIIESNIAENKFDLSVRYTGTHTSGDPTDYYVTIRLVD